MTGLIEDIHEIIQAVLTAIFWSVTDRLILVLSLPSDMLFDKLFSKSTYKQTHTVKNLVMSQLYFPSGVGNPWLVICVCKGST